jgi:hypothetical protein
MADGSHKAKVELLSQIVEEYGKYFVWKQVSSRLWEYE